MKSLNIENRKGLLVLGIVVLLTIITVTTGYISSRCYAVKIGDKLIGNVKEKEDVVNILKDIKSEYEDKYNKEVKILENITFEKTSKFKGNGLDKDDIKSKIKNNITVKVEGYSLKVDGQDLAILDNKMSANKILEDLKAKYLEGVKSDKIKEVSFFQDINITKKFVDFSEIIETEKAYNLISIGKDEIKKYVVQEGDTISQLSVRYDISLKDIKKANPEIDLDKLQIGQTLKLTIPKPLISVKVIEETEYKEQIPYEVRYEETDSMYQGDSKIKKQGEKGEKIVEAEIIWKDGVEINKDLINEQIIKEPTEQIVLKGTKRRPKTMAYGSFRNPSRGSLTSRYGPRWGSNHNGIDIGMSTGTPVKATDGGKVIFAGWNNSYGYLVKIDHENGYVTYYAHNSKLKVKKGDRVYRGQVISLSGATGNVTGPHLHFEVRKNGQPIDPLKFLKY
ncbi:peptidoglycan DD-metalloendopeptidase family protein [Dethiothermospora halolimnae]|uniref:peptidoglycan DD-metalloendopeptidase family protein n=1 Tax=Dethiothermospora halolimnae TaxID=3114390 RepID=UPI003CCB8A3C